jgi:hypothetical protein
VQALLLKAETVKRIYQRQSLSDKATAKVSYRRMEDLYVQLFDLGYREMPDKMYRDWLQSLNAEKAKYINPQVRGMMEGGR